MDAISFMYVRYGNFVDSESAKLYKQIAALQLVLLQASNKFNGIEKEVSLNSNDTKSINLPAEASQ